MGCDFGKIPTYDIQMSLKLKSFLEELQHSQPSGKYCVVFVVIFDLKIRSNGHSGKMEFVGLLFLDCIYLFIYFALFCAPTWTTFML